MSNIPDASENEFRYSITATIVVAILDTALIYCEFGLSLGYDCCNQLAFQLPKRN